MRYNGLGEMRGTRGYMTSAHTVLLEKHGGKRQLCDICFDESTILRQVLKV
jgi:hypothetical protein